MVRNRYAIEATNLLNNAPSGIARYAGSLVDGLRRIEARETDPFEITQLYRFSRFKRRQLLPMGPGISRQGWVQGLWPLRHDFDVVHATAHRLPDWPKPAKVITIHDVYAAVGINYHEPEERERQLRVYRDLAARADYAICDSENTRKDFLEYFDFDESRARVVHLGVDPQFHPRSPEALSTLKQRYGIQGEFLLIFGSKSENKNVQRLLSAYLQSKASRDFQLMIAGPMREAHKQEFMEQAASMGLQRQVLVPGYVPDTDVPLLYCAAKAFLFPSTYEGFGIPILEAMASGTAVLTSNGGACPEVAGGHAVVVDPYSVEDIARGIDAVVEMTQEQKNYALAYAQAKTWDITVRKTLQIYQLAMGNRR